MYKPVEIAKNTYWIGVNDRRTELFENLWPIEKGVSYNSYFIDDDKTVVIDTVEAGKMNDFFDKIDSLLNGRKLDYLVINHLEPDHAGAISQTLLKYQGVTLVGNKKTFKILKDLYRLEIVGHEIANEEVLETGSHKLQFILTPMLHWPETMMTYDMSTETLFSGDAFGSFGTLDGGVTDEELDYEVYEEEIRRYYSNIVGKYWNPVQRALGLLEGTPLSAIASTHGPIWKKHIGRMVENYKHWSNFEAEEGVVIVYGSMYGNTEKMAEAIARKLNEEGIQKIKIYDSSKTHQSYILNDIFKYKAVAFGSSAYNGIIFPPMESLLSKIINTGIKNRIIGIFGSATWGGGGVKAIDEFAERMEWDVAGESIQAKGGPTASDLEVCEEIAVEIVKKLKQ